MQDVQIRTLPKLNEIEGNKIEYYYEPFEGVSGDFYGVFPLRENEYGLVIGDVSGHGVPASLIMEKALTALHIYTERFISPKEVLLHVNEYLLNNIPAESFVTIFFGILFTEKLLLKYVRAGHSPLLIHNPNRNPVLSEFEPKGTPVGFAKTSIFKSFLKEEEIKLESGDLILQYTDGLSEAMNYNEEEYGIGRLRQFIENNSQLELKDFINKLVKDVRYFTENEQFQDDVTVLGLKIKNNSTFSITD